MSAPAPGSAGDPERVLSQALRAMAGGRRGDAAMVSGAVDPGAGQATRRFTAVQIVLIAVIAGLIVGIGAGITVLLLR